MTVYIIRKPNGDAVAIPDKRSAENYAKTVGGHIEDNDDTLTPADQAKVDAEIAQLKQEESAS